MNGKLSKWVPDKIGVPQGGSLSPVLWLLYIDNLSIINSIAGVKMGIFEDDLAVYTENYKDSDSLNGLQEAVTMVQWYSYYHGIG